MANKTLIPAFKATVGDWEYYLCLMKYAEVDRSIKFSYEFGGNKDLGTMIQRGISARTEEITQYLLTNEHRFLGALVVAVFGGHPEYISLEMADPGNVLEGVDREFGVLTFDGSHRFFALDGQHRLRAIKDALMKEPLLGSEDIGVIVVPHFDTKEGQQRTRRLFTNINRNAVRTTATENVALDEDDGFAILTRRFLEEDPFLSTPNVVQVFTRQGLEGQVKLAARNVGKTSPYWTTMVILYDMLGALGWDLDPTMSKSTRRATDAVLDESFVVLTRRLDELLGACGELRGRYEGAKHPADLRGRKGLEAKGHPMMRPVVQLAVVRSVRQIIEQGQLTWDQCLERLRELDWQLGAAPWLAVFVPDRGAMVVSKEFTDLLRSLLLVHLAPKNKAEIGRALKGFRALKGRKYPWTEEQLAERIPAHA
jgi:DNA sulfur modification protein DndB